MPKNKLTTYQKKRNFKKTCEPKRGLIKGPRKALFIVQKHYASHLHYDFRLSIGGVLKSWVVPKGMPRAFGIKRLAIQTEDHPLSYAYFEGTIPEGEYGAGKVKIWDRGEFYNLKNTSLKSSLKQGKVEVFLKGEKMKGAYALIRFQDKNWLVFKVEAARITRIEGKL